MFDCMIYIYYKCIIKYTLWATTPPYTVFFYFMFLNDTIYAIRSCIFKGRLLYVILYDNYPFS